MNCPKCNNPLIKKQWRYCVLIYCNSCFSYERIEEKDCCDTPNQLFVRHKSGNGTQIRIQCFNCGKLGTKAQNRKEINVDIETLKFSDLEFDSARKQKFSNDWNIAWDEFKRQRKEHFLFYHSNYLMSERWKIKRELVLKRDNNICQSCLQNKATQVHHLDYNYHMNEPLYRLISVCRRCHEIITTMDQGKDDYQNIH